MSQYSTNSELFIYFRNYKLLSFGEEAEEDEGEADQFAKVNAPVGFFLNGITLLRINPSFITPPSLVESVNLQ